MVATDRAKMKPPPSTHVCMWLLSGCRIKTQARPGFRHGMACKKALLLRHHGQVVIDCCWPMSCIACPCQSTAWLPLVGFCSIASLISLHSSTLHIHAYLPPTHLPTSLLTPGPGANPFYTITTTFDPYTQPQSSSSHQTSNDFYLIPIYFTLPDAWTSVLGAPLT
ncbi:hypothetical protein GQ44DRAFT_320182 [Phaeosphaeriaceae sp. PMI808]|nr:hypothetical protein GQ44DRAFT_320182 [Phaeosphaeriaceae sp. PMI808]